MMNTYNPYICHFDYEVARAKKMGDEQLKFAIVDCLECVKLGINPEKYIDQVKVYRQELARRVR